MVAGELALDKEELTRAALGAAAWRGKPAGSKKRLCPGFQTPQAVSFFDTEGSSFTKRESGKGTNSCPKVNEAPLSPFLLSENVSD